MKIIYRSRNYRPGSYRKIRRRAVFKNGYDILNKWNLMRASIASYRLYNIHIHFSSNKKKTATAMCYKRKYLEGEFDFFKTFLPLWLIHNGVGRS